MYYRKKCRNLNISVTLVAYHSSKLRVSAMFLVLVVGNLAVLIWDVLQGHSIHIIFVKIWIKLSLSLTHTYTHTHTHTRTQRVMDFRSLRFSFQRQESRLKIQQTKRLYTCVVK